MFEKRAMLVELTIRQWTARKYDRKVSREVDQTHSASDAGRYNKQLIAKKALEPIVKQANIIRDFHYKYTLPWGDNGQRLLPARRFLEYRNKLGEMRNEFNALVGTFVSNYPQLIQEAQQHLGSMFRFSDYPTTTEIRNAFGVELDIFPVPTSQDFRIEVANEEGEAIRAQIQEATAERQKAAARSCYVRVADVLQRMKSQCVEGKTRITDSLVSDMHNLSGILDDLNIGEDPELTRLGQQIRQDLLIDAQDLRGNAKVRKAAGERAAQLLESIQPELTS